MSAALNTASMLTNFAATRYWSSDCVSLICEFPLIPHLELIHDDRTVVYSLKRVIVLRSLRAMPTL